MSKIIPEAAPARQPISKPVKPVSTRSLAASVGRAVVAHESEERLLADRLRRLSLLRDDPSADPEFITRIEAMTSEISARRARDGQRIDAAKLDLRERMRAAFA